MCQTENKNELYLAREKNLIIARKGGIMKNLWSLSVLVMFIIVLFLLTGCPSINTGSGSFTYDGTTYPLTNGAFEDWGDQYFDIVLASSGLNTRQWEGIGNVVWFDLLPPSTLGEPGTYDWAGTDDFLLWEGAISFNYNADTDTGTDARRLVRGCERRSCNHISGW